MTVDTHRARHVGPDPVLGELNGLGGVVFAYRASGTTITWGDDFALTYPYGPADQARALDTVAMLDGTHHAALLNEVCGTCRAHLADADPAQAPTDSPWCQGCLDEDSHAAEERRYAEATHRLAGPELVAS